MRRKREAVRNPAEVPAAGGRTGSHRGSTLAQVYGNFDGLSVLHVVDGLFNLVETVEMLGDEHAGMEILLLYEANCFFQDAGGRLDSGKT